MIIKPGLYLVSTPIGNLQDITIRALETLKNSDLIICEDTRVTNKLLAKHGIKSRLKIYNDHSDSSLRKFIKDEIDSSKVVSLVSDAGTPLICDPGYKLVRYLKENNIHVDALPGPCALVASLTISGLPTDKFFFAGFLPKTQFAKIKTFKSIEKITATVVFYETSSRLVDSLNVALEVLGDRYANVGRELTKLYQESNTAPISQLIDFYTQKKPKGEIVLAIEGYKNQISVEKIEEEVKSLMQGGLSARTITDQLFNQYSDCFKRSQVYKIVNQLIK